MRLLRTLALLAGLGVVAWLVLEAGPATLWAQLSRLSWRLAVLMLPQAAVSLLHGAGWRCAFPGALPPLRPLVALRLAGEAVSDTTPTGTLGGDALKAWLARDAGIPLREGLVSVVVAKTALVLAQVLFLGLGLAFARTGPDPRPVVWGMLAILAGVGFVAGGGFLWAQRRGLFRVGSRMLAWLGLGGRAATAAAHLDTDLALYYRERRGRFAESIGLHLLGWLAGSLEVWLGLRLLGAPVAWTTALVVEAAATGVRSAGFLVPGSLGIQEGGLVAVLGALGIGAPLALAFAAVRRVREAVWALAGYACLAAWRGGRRRRPGAAA